MKPWALVVSCEHASREWPTDGPPSGLDPAVFETHAAWDPGAAHAAARIAQNLGAPLFLGRFTRLFVDLNRSPGTEEVVPEQAFGVEVPANRGLDARARLSRVAAFHAPYWNDVRGALQVGLQNAHAVLHMSVHSFVETYGEQRRDLDLGLLFDPERPLEQRIADRLYGALSGLYLVRENQPYDGRADALTTALRKELAADRYAGVEVEINHRLLGDIDRAAVAIEAALRVALAVP